jgi:hypothetical protein
MTKTDSTLGSATGSGGLAKSHNEALIEPPAPTRRPQLRVANMLEDYERLAEYLRRLGPHTVIRFEATGNYHRRWRIFFIGKASTCG